MPVSERTPDEIAEIKRAMLASRLKALSTDVEESVSSIEPRPAGARVRISVDQYRIWLHHSMHPELPLYNEPISIFHEGPLDPLLVQQALEFYASRHEAWRTSFSAEGEDIYQDVASVITVPVAFHDLSGLSQDERQEQETRIAKQNAIEPFDLTRPPLLRAALVRMSTGEDRLHLAVHHLIFDGTAIRDSLVPELVTIYAALAAGKQPQLPPLQLQYPDFALWRSLQVDSPSMQRSLDFWKQTLAGDLPVPRLPVDRARPANISQRGAMRRFTFSSALTAQLRAVGVKHRATLYLVLLTSLEALLFHYSGQNDVIIGTAANGRTRPELHGMMGYILDTFPVRVRPDADQSFLQLLKTVRAAVFNALEAADLPFNQIVEAAGVKRDPSYHPIFQTFFSFPPPVEAPAPGWVMQPKLVDTGTAKFDLYIEAEEHGDETPCSILYNTDLFDAPTIDRLIGHWTTMLHAIALDQEITLGALPILTEPERQLMLTDWNNSQKPVPASTMHDLFVEQAHRTPDSIAVRFGKVQLTYAHLNDRAERMAHVLQQAGSGPGKLVAICIDRSENLLAGLLAILKTGATYLPLDPGTPLARIAMCVEEAEPAILLTQQSVTERLPTPLSQVILLEHLLTAAEALPDGTFVPAGLAGPADSAYIIHTSGSTGKPKAVELSHLAVVNLLLSFQRQPGLTADDILVAVTTISFDIAVLELFLPIITGAQVVIAPRTTALDPFELADLIEATNCTILQATPATWRSLIASEWQGHPGLRVLCGGEALSRDLAGKLLACGVDLWNVYGPTETCIWSTMMHIQSAAGAMPIGRPIANTTAYILDAHQQPVPIGVAGELYLGGLGLAKGYRGQPQLTSEKFVSPAVAGGQRLYRTGDYALYRADGTIECQGRADNQVKVRGYRIELEEVEFHLSAYPEAASAAARVWKDEDAGNRLTGYVVAKRGKAIDTREIRRFLQTRLPDYMIPTQFILLAEMPLTPNGKTDRKALPESFDQPLPAAMTDEVMTEAEERLGGIWCDLLKVPRISKHDNFFALGGHSLQLVAMFTRANREFNTNLPLTTVFDAPTLGGLAAVLQRKTNISALVPVQTHGAKAPLFMAHSYLLYQGLSGVLATDQPFYGLRELELDGELSIAARALRYVAEMRTVQAHGPYRVAGWCAAGPLAVEITRQLLLQGETVDTLLLFDAWLPEYLEEVRHAQYSGSFFKCLKIKAAFHLQKTRPLSLSGKSRYLFVAVRRLVKEQRDKVYSRNWDAMTRLSKALKLPLPQFMHNTSLQTLAAMRHFRADMLPVKITLIRARDSEQNGSALEGCGWERVAGDGISVEWVPGDHESMFKGNNLKIAGRIVQATLDNAKAAFAGQMDLSPQTSSR